MGEDENGAASSPLNGVVADGPPVGTAVPSSSLGTVRILLFRNLFQLTKLLKIRGSSCFQLTAEPRTTELRANELKKKTFFFIIVYKKLRRIHIALPNG